MRCRRLWRWRGAGVRPEVSAGCALDQRRGRWSRAALPQRGGGGGGQGRAGRSVSAPAVGPPPGDWRSPPLGPVPMLFPRSSRLNAPRAFCRPLAEGQACCSARLQPLGFVSSLFVRVCMSRALSVFCCFFSFSLLSFSRIHLLQYTGRVGASVGRSLATRLSASLSTTLTLLLACILALTTPHHSYQFAQLSLGILWIYSVCPSLSSAVCLAFACCGATAVGQVRPGPCVYCLAPCPAWKLAGGPPRTRACSRGGGWRCACERAVSSRAFSLVFSLSPVRRACVRVWRHCAACSLRPAHQPAAALQPRPLCAARALGCR